jgi:putative serine protease PepD
MSEQEPGPSGERPWWMQEWGGESGPVTPEPGEPTPAAGPPQSYPAAADPAASPPPAAPPPAAPHGPGAVAGGGGYGSGPAWGTPSPGQPGEEGYPWTAGAGAPVPSLPPAHAARRSPSPTLLLIAAVVIALVAGGAGAAIGVHLARAAPAGSSSVSGGGSETPVVDARAGSAPQTQVEAVAKAVSPSVVLISETTPALQGTGSGIILRPDGYILTNNHVVSAAASGGSIRVTFADGKTLAAAIVGRDPSSDLAVIKVSGVTGLTAARLADSAAAVVGETVLAFGSPLGLQSTVTEGIVSAVDRPVFTGDSSVSDTNAVIDAIQTDAAINPGNSGGPLVDTRGDVIGVDSAIATLGSSSTSSPESGSIGIGFAIPINSARAVANQLITLGHAIHAELGVEGTDAPGNSGARIVTVISGGGAARAGLRPADVVTSVDGSPVPNFDTLVVDIRNHLPGQTVTLTFRRDGRTHTARVTLGSVVN